MRKTKRKRFIVVHIFHVKNILPWEDQCHSAWQRSGTGLCLPHSKSVVMWAYWLREGVALKQVDLRHEQLKFAYVLAGAIAAWDR